MTFLLFLFLLLKTFSILILRIYHLLE
jgi:hypothetical protein